MDGVAFDPHRQFKNMPQTIKLVKSKEAAAAGGQLPSATAAVTNRLFLATSIKKFVNDPAQ